MIDGDLVAVDADPAVGLALGLAPGPWWAGWRATDGTCEVLAVQLLVVQP